MGTAKDGTFASQLIVPVFSRWEGTKYDKHKNYIHGFRSWYEVDRPKTPDFIVTGANLFEVGRDNERQTLRILLYSEFSVVV